MFRSGMLVPPFGGRFGFSGLLFPLFVVFPLVLKFCGAVFLIVRLPQGPVCQIANFLPLLAFAGLNRKRFQFGVPIKAIRPRDFFLSQPDVSSMEASTAASAASSSGVNKAILLPPLSCLF